MFLAQNDEMAVSLDVGMPGNTYHVVICRWENALSQHGLDFALTVFESFNAAYGYWQSKSSYYNLPIEREL